MRGQLVTDKAFRRQNGEQRRAVIQIQAGHINRLIAAGLKRLEVTSFVHPKKVPQMADAEDVLAQIDKRPGVTIGGVLRNWGLVFVGNFGGAFTVAVLLAVLWPLWRDARGLVLAGVATLGVATFALYRVVGTPAALEPQATAAMPTTLEEAIGQLEAELKKKPNEPEGWRLLGKSYAALQRYAELRCRCCPDPVTSSFFVSDRGTRLTEWCVRWTFVKLSREIGLRGADDSRGPRLHDLRHRPATATLLSGYRHGVDVERHLPELSAYLGHAHVTDTYWYLTATPELLHYVMRRAQRPKEQRP